MYKTFFIGVVGVVIGVAATFYFMNERVAPQIASDEVRSAKPFAQSSKKYIGDTMAGGVAYAVSTVSPFLTDAARITISQNYNGAPNDEKGKHTVAAEQVECSVTEENAHECSVRFSEVESRVISGEVATVLWDSLVATGYFGQNTETKTIVIENVLCTVDDYQAQTTPGTVLLGFGCTFE